MLPPGTTLAPGADSRAVAGLLDGLGRRAQESGLPPAAVDRVVVAAGEALANVVEHGAAAVSVSWEMDGGAGRLRIVGDTGPDSGALAGASLPADPFATSGRGLYLVVRLADRVEAVPGCLDLWFVARPEET